MLHRLAIGTLALLITVAALPARAAETVHDFVLEAIEGGALPLSQFAGKPILLVNTASLCGFTYQYEMLQDVWQRYRDQGLIVLGVPSDDFGGQELESNAAVKEFCEVNFAIDFPMSEVVHVKGSRAHPLFLYIRETLGDEAAPQWNFNKYFIDADGIPRTVWRSSTRPDDPAILAAVEAALAR